MSFDSKRVKERVAERAAVEKCVNEWVAELDNLLDQEGQSEYYRQTFWLTLQTRAGERCEQLLQKEVAWVVPEGCELIRPLSDAAFRKMDTETVGFGKWASRTWRDVDLEYIDWLVDRARATIGYFLHPVMDRRRRRDATVGRYGAKDDDDE